MASSMFPVLMMTNASQYSVRGRYILTGHLGNRIVDYWYAPPGKWRAEQDDEGLILISDGQSVRTRLTGDPLKPPNEIQLLNSPKQLLLTLLGYTLIELGPLVKKANHRHTGRPSSVHPVHGPVGKDAGTITIDAELGWVLDLETNAGQPAELMTTEFSRGTWDPGIFSFSGSW